MRDLVDMSLFKVSQSRRESGRGSSLESSHVRLREAVHKINGPTMYSCG